MVSTLLMARILGPELTGITAATIILILNYSVNAHLGTLNALNQRYPYLIGQGTPESMEEIKKMLNVVLGCVSIGAGVVFLIVLGLACWQVIAGSHLMALGFAFGAMIAVFRIFITYYIFVVRSSNQFKYFSRYTLLSSLLPLIWVVGAKYGGVVGQWLAFIVTESLMCFIIYRKVGREIKPEWDIKMSWKYIKLGFPIYVVGALFIIFSTIDRLTAAFFLGTTALGVYGVASITAFLAVIPGVIGQIMWPRIAEKLGILEKDWQRILPYIEKPTYLMAYLLPILIGVVILVIPPVTKMLLPRYDSGIVAGQIATLSIYFLGLMCMYTVFLGTSLRLLPYGIITILGIGINFVGSYFSVHFGLGLIGIAWAKVIAYGVVAVFLYWYVEGLFNQKLKDKLLRLIILFAQMAWVSFLAFGAIPWIFPDTDPSVTGQLRGLGIQVSIMILATSLLAWFALRNTGVWEDVMAIVFRKLQPFFKVE